jgi:hypothetical protein
MRCDEGYREFYIPLKKKTDRYEEKEEKKKGQHQKGQKSIIKGPSLIK